MDFSLFNNLSSFERKLVCTAILLDGFEAVTYLKNDKDKGAEMEVVATALAKLQPELRMPLLATLLRQTKSVKEQ